MPDHAISENPLFNNHLVYRLPYAGRVQEGIRYGSGSRLIDLYLPAQIDEPAPVVVLLTGYPDPGFERVAGKQQMQIQSYRDWAELLAASGIAAVLYSNVEPTQDALAVLEFLRAEAPQLGIDPARVGIWSCSGNVPNALHLMSREPSIRCAALLYGFMLDTDESDIVAKTSQAVGFVNPNRGMADFSENLPTLIVRAGRDEFPGLNDSIDCFEAEALARNSPVSVIRYAEGVHGFDVLDDSRRSMEMIKLCIGFLQLRLNVY